MPWRRQLHALVRPGSRARVALPAGAAAWREDDGPLDVSRRPRQGRLGDCWVLAAMLAVHEAAPERIAAMVGDAPAARRDTAPRSWTVSLPGRRGVAPVVIALDRLMPVDAEGLWLGAQVAGRGPGWAGLVEKALAVHVAGSYRWLARGFGRTGLRLLTGVPVRSSIVRLPDAATLARWIEDGHAVLASSHPLSALVGTAHGRWPINHVMVVVGADPSSGHVDLRNPWRPEDVLRVDARTFRRAVLCVDRTAVPLR